MIKINKWFSPDIIKKYLQQVGEKVKDNNKSDILTFLKFGNIEYIIKIDDLLTQPLEKIKDENTGIKLYMYLCEIQKYRNATGREILEELSKCNVNVEKNSNTEYTVVHNGQSKKLTINDNNYLKGDGLKIIRQLIIEGIGEFESRYTAIIHPHLQYYQNRKTFNNLIDHITYQLNNCLCIPGESINMKYKYKDMPYIIHYSLIDKELRHEIMSSLGITTCPYCNRQYITSWSEENSDAKNTTADLDHFYQKSIYPLFALSLFNFVPSCQICNSRMKGSSQMYTLYPYEEGFDDNLKFSLDLIGETEEKKSKEQLQSWLGVHNKDITNLSLSLNFTDDFENNETIDPMQKALFKLRAKGSIEQFKLKEVYDVHKFKALDVILKKRIFFEGAYKEYMDALKGKINFDYPEIDVKTVIIGYDWNNDNYDEPLSKLIHDIFYSDI